ncbi:hypothetical protein VTN77DRAFT_7292 [Rasamsonia byssochlamydoides]|uniref:uncharacterized protein n=1 Tax=Rasamsonia byssochlamydoides TaxID=89139 RepID=UPI0037435DF0
MTAQITNVAIIGASGSIGKIILDALLTSSRFTVTVLSRHSSTATFPANVNVRKTNFSESELQTALQGQDAVVSALGVAGFSDQKKVIDAAVRAGVKRFIPSEFSVNTLSDAVLRLLPLFGQKKEVLEYLKSKESEGLTWTGIGTGLLFDWGLSNGFLGYDIDSHTATIWDSGDKPFTLTNSNQLGQAVVSVLQQPSETANQYFYVASVVTSQEGILNALEEATATKWTVSYTSTEAQVSEARKRIGKGDSSAAYALVRATTFGNLDGLRADYTKEENLANDLLGLKLESVQETVQRVAKSST